MKKRNFAIYALVGAMAVSPIFTSCIDNEETASVTDIRNAKAEQLKAIADLNNAKAASTAAVAAADAALIKAKAEAAKAQAELQDARTAMLETQNEIEKAQLEVTIKNAEKELARIQAEIDQQAINIQATLIWAELQLKEAQKNLENATKGYDEFQKAKLQTLAQEYATAVSNLISYQQALTAEKSKLVKLETGLMKAEEALEATIAANNNQIALNNIQIEALKKYVDYMENPQDFYYGEYIEKNQALNIVNDKRNVARAAWNEAMNSVDDEAIDEAWKAVLDDEFYQFVMYGRIADEENEGNYFGVFGIQQYFSLTKNYFESNVYKYGEFTYGNYCGDTYTFEYAMNADIRQIELYVNDILASRKQSIATWNNEITTKKAELATAEAATVAAKKAWDDAAAADKDAKKAEYQAALDTELRLKEEIANLQNSVDNATVWLNVYEKAWDIAKNADKYNEALQAKIKAYNDANVAAYAETLAAWEKYQDLDVVYYETYAERDALYNLYWNAIGVENQINSLEESNKQLLDANARAEKLLTQYDGYEMPYKLAIEFQKEWVAVKEAIVKAQEVKVEEAKAALDAAMPTEEETPAE